MPIKIECSYVSNFSLLRNHVSILCPMNDICRVCVPPTQANITEMEVSIPSKLHNSLIGSKGRFVRSIMEECGGVHIHFPTEGSGIDTVTIRGPAEEVEKAKKQLLSLAQDKV